MARRPRIALVTGATGAIGRAITAGLAALPNFEVVAVGRDPSRLAELTAQLKGRTARPLRCATADLSCHKSIANLAQHLTGPIDVLVNNAAVAPPHRQRTKSGIEVTFATNVLGYVWTMRELWPALRLGREARVINVASYWAGDLDLDDLEFEHRPYDNDTAYRQSKQANRMLSRAWATRMKPDGITVNSCHPGDVNSRLSNDLGFGGADSPEEGADTPLWLATDKELRGVTGQYYEHRHLSDCRFSGDQAAVERLARICDGYA